MRKDSNLIVVQHTVTIQAKGTCRQVHCLLGSFSRLLFLGVKSLQCSARDHKPLLDYILVSGLDQYTVAIRTDN